MSSTLDPPVSSDLVDDRAIEDIEADRLSHAPLARQVATIAATEATPLTVGIFGPWGSGKSSLLKVIQSELQRSGVLTVYLDAWRHADLPLARQFVSSTAEQLARATVATSGQGNGSKRGRFAGYVHAARARWVAYWGRGRERRARRQTWGLLYETRRVRRFRAESILRGLAALLITLVAFAAISVFLSWFVMLMFEVSYASALQRTVSATLGASVLAAIVTAAVASSTMDSEQTRPGSEEELVRALGSVLEKYAKGKRVVFLVDELDRCEPHEVLSTLKTMRAFLEAPQSVFVVAADRDVVDQAISRLHAAPAQPSSAYYTGTGSILDKLFQIQVDVPPLRHGRLSDLAVELVTDRDGIWKTLGEGRTAEVVAILIPAHVESPRRVKVLLNAYVTAMRIAYDRHSTNRAEAADPFDKYLTIAKLVCLQTEFPRFADAVADDPLLLPALTAMTIAEEAGEELDSDIDAVAAFAEPTKAMALEFFSGQRSVEESIRRDDSAGLGKTQEADLGASAEVGSARVHELLRYLYYTREIEDPTLDIIYGTSLGARYGLDPRVADQLEREALDGQDRRASELVASLTSDEEKIRAFRVLCDQVRAPGIQARHAFAALLRTAEAVPDLDLSTVGDHLLDAVRNVTRTAALPSQDVVPVLRLTRWFPEPARGQHQRDLLDRPEWQESDEDVAAVLRTADHWSHPVQVEARGVVVALIGAHARATLDALTGLRPATLATIWSPRMWEEVVEHESFPDLAIAIASEDRGQAFDGLVALARAGYAPDTLNVYVDLGGAKDETEAEALFDLTAENIGEVKTWLSWAQHIHNLPSEPSASLSGALNRLVAAVKAQDATPEQVESWAHSVALAGGRPDESELALPPAEPAWPQNATTTAIQRRVSEAIAHCQSAWPNTQAFASARQHAIETLLSGTVPISDEACEFGSTEALKLVRMGAVPSRWIVSVVERAGNVPSTRLPPNRLLHLVGPLAVGAAELTDDFTFPPDLVEQAVANIEGPGVAVLEGWLRHGEPSRRSVLDFLRRVARAWRQLDSAFAAHVSSLTKTSATNLILALMGSHPVDSRHLLREVPAEAVVQKKIAERYGEVIREAHNSEARATACKLVAALKLESAEARRLVIDAVSGQIAEQNRSAATDFSRDLPRWVYDAPGGQSLLRGLNDLSKTKHASRLLDRLFLRRT